MHTSLLLVLQPGMKVDVKVQRTGPAQRGYIQKDELLKVRWWIISLGDRSTLRGRTERRTEGRKEDKRQKGCFYQTLLISTQLLILMSVSHQTHFISYNNLHLNLSKQPLAVLFHRQFSHLVSSVPSSPPSQYPSKCYLLCGQSIMISKGWEKQMLRMQLGDVLLC